jgi:hypothetical protein
MAINGDVAPLPAPQDLPPGPVGRERDIRRDIQDRLKATGEFHEVWLGPIEQPNGRRASATRCCAIEPADTELADYSDAAEEGDSVCNCRINLTVASRSEDEQLRDEWAERLLNLVRNTVNGQSLANLTFVQFTKVKSWHWQKVADSERRITAVLRCQYYEAGWAVSDTTE